MIATLRDYLEAWMLICGVLTQEGISEHWLQVWPWWLTPPRLEDEQSILCVCACACVCNKQDIEGGREMHATEHDGSDAPPHYSQSRKEKVIIYLIT